MKSYRHTGWFFLAVLTPACARSVPVSMSFHAELGAGQVRTISLTKQWVPKDDPHRTPEYFSQQSPQFEFRAGDMRKGEVLVALVLPGAAKRPAEYTPRQVSVQLDSNHPGIAIDQNRWESARRIRAHTRFWRDFSGVGGNKAFNYGAHRFELPPGVGMQDAEALLSPDGRWLAVLAFSRSASDAERPGYAGVVYLDIYRVAGATRQISIRGSYRGLMTLPATLAAAWLSSQHFVMAADADRTAIIVCDLGVGPAGHAPTFDIDPTDPKFLGVLEFNYPFISPVRLAEYASGFYALIRIADGGDLNAGWHLDSKNGHSAVMEGYSRSDMSERGMAFLQSDAPPRALGDGPYRIHDMELIDRSTGQRQPLSIGDFETPPYHGFVRYPVKTPQPAYIPVAVIPFTTTAPSQTFSFTFEDPFQGVAGRELKVLISYGQNIDHACAFTFQLEPKRLVLMDDTGNLEAGSLAFGDSGALHNSQCRISKMRIDRDPTSASISLLVEPSRDFAGRRNIYVKTDDYATSEFTWDWRATWEIPTGQLKSR